MSKRQPHPSGKHENVHRIRIARVVAVPPHHRAFRPGLLSRMKLLLARL